MRQLKCLWLAISIALVFCALSVTSQTVSAQESSRASSLKLADADESTLELILDNSSDRVSLVFSNNSTSTLWFPVEPDPAYRLDKESCTLSIWLGYSEVINGRQFGQYMLPEMHPVRPGEVFKFDLTSSSLAQNVFKYNLKAKIQVRVATKDIPFSRARNNQSLEDYIINSVVIKSEDPERR